jgi:hypothetical protein
VRAGGIVPGSRKWEMCNDLITMPRDHPVSMVPIIAELSAVMPVMVYNGDSDLNCNFLGTSGYLDSMEWDGAERWATAGRALWKVRLGGVRRERDRGGGGRGRQRRRCEGEVRGEKERRGREERGRGRERERGGEGSERERGRQERRRVACCQLSSSLLSFTKPPHNRCL